MKYDLPEHDAPENLSLWERLILWLERQPTPQPVIPVDYRDRISVVTWLIVFGLGLSVLYTMPTTVITFHALGSPISLMLSETLIAAIFMAVLAATGTESIIRVHPRFIAAPRTFQHTWPFWSLPMAIVMIAAYVLPVTPSGLIRVLGLLLSGSLLGLAFFGLYATVERGPSGFRRARFVLDALAYGAALILFLFVYQTRALSLLSGTLIAMTAILLAVEILRSSGALSGRPGRPP